MRTPATLLTLATLVACEPPKPPAAPGGPTAMEAATVPDLADDAVTAALEADYPRVMFADPSATNSSERQKRMRTEPERYYGPGSSW